MLEVGVELRCSGLDPLTSSFLLRLAAQLVKGEYKTLRLRVRVLEAAAKLEFLPKRTVPIESIQ